MSLFHHSLSRSRRGSRVPPAPRKAQLSVETLENRFLLSGDPSLSLVLSAHTIAENAGAAATTGTVTRNNMDTSLALTVNLKSSDTTQATVPASVTIPAGYASAMFAVNAVDNHIVDSGHTVTITATAASPVAPGLDQTFGSGGITSVPLNVSISSNYPRIKVQPDGKILAVAGAPNNGATWAITRTNPDGSPDTTFGTNGTALTTFANSTTNDSKNCANGIALQPDGKIIVVGNIYTTTDAFGGWGIARYNADGTPDTSFGSGGQTEIFFSGEGGWLYDAAVLSNGEILVGGDRQDPMGFAVARLTSNGSIDTRFGTNGFAGINPDPTHTWSDTGGQAMLVQPDGKIVMTGFANSSGLPVVRFNADGTPDTTFNGTGVELIPSATFGSYGSVVGNELALQQDGKIVVVGTAYSANSYSSDWVIARVNTNGSLDTSFSGDGVDALDFAGGYDYAYDVAVQMDGKIVVGGQASSPGDYMALVRYNTDGTHDGSLGTNGELLAPVPTGHGAIRSIDLQADGKLVALATGYATTYITRFDTGLLAASDTLSVTNTDGLPVANAGGPCWVAEGGSVQLDASGTTDSVQDPSMLTYAWDLNGDGIYGETGAAATRGDETGIKPTFSAAGLDGPRAVVVHLKVTDSSGQSSYAEALINVTNVAPTAVLSNNGPVNEASPVTVTFSNQYDPSPADTNTGLHYSFATSSAALATTYADAGTAASASFTFSEDGSYTIYGRIIDKDNGYTDYQTTVTVNEVAPIAAVSESTSIVRGQAQTFTFTAQPGVAADQDTGFTYTINWGDGSTDVISGSANIQVPHIFTDANTYTVKVWATDEDGFKSVQPGTQTVHVTAAALRGNDLVVGGTTGADTIIIKPTDRTGDLAVTINNISIGTFQPTGRIIVYAQAGNDSIQLQYLKIDRTVVRVAVSAILFGGNGNDTIDASGSSANNVLVGGDGSNFLQGGSGRDILIAGSGGSTLSGGNGDDILIGGTTDYDNNLTALTALLTEWGRTDLDYQARINLLGSGSDPLTAQTVHDNGAVDRLFGQGGNDWFFASVGGSSQDYLGDRKHHEVVTAIL